MEDRMRRTAVGATVSMDHCLDELTRRIQSMIELKTGFAEPHQMSRELQRLFKAHDSDSTGTMTPAEFRRVLVQLSIGGTEAEYQALFDRYDVNENGLLTFKEFADGVTGVRPSPLGDPQCRKVLERFKAKLLKRGTTGGGTPNFGRALRVMDKDKSGVLSKDELRAGMERLGCSPMDAEMEVVMQHFDRNGDGTVSVTEFLRALRGALNPRRKELVLEAFSRLDKNNDGTVTLDELAKIYDASQHPAVLKGEKSQEDILKDFSKSWDKDGDGRITGAEFEDYYKDVSAGIESDDYFELMMRNVWHISGGEGWCANTSNRRVLVTLKDKTQRVCEIKDDLGIRPNDLAKMKANLLRQHPDKLGFDPSDIRRIELAY